MSSRSIRKRRHREDFSEYVTGKEKFENIASQWKNFGFPNKMLFIKALTDHAAKQATHIHDENCQHEVADLPQEVADKMTDEEWIDAPLTAEEKAAFANADLEHVHGEGCTHHHDDRAERQAHIDQTIADNRARGAYEVLEHQTSQLDMWNETDDNEAVRDNEAASDAEQLRLREGIEANLAADRANLDFLPDETK